MGLIKITTKPKHLNWIDYIKGIGIILVVIGHTTDIGDTWRVWIYTFHMPLFFCISGYLFKHNHPIIRMAQRLLLPLLIYMLLIVIPFEINQLILAKTSIPKIIWRIINVYTSSKATAFWFPYSLFLGLAIWSYLEKYKSKRLPVICFISLLIAYLLDLIGLEQNFIL